MAKGLPPTNTQVVLDMMEFSAVGALKQAFVMTAIAEYSRQVIASEVTLNNGFISAEAWKIAAQECKASLDAMMKKR